MKILSSQSSAIFAAIGVALRPANAAGGVRGLGLKPTHSTSDSSSHSSSDSSTDSSADSSSDSSSPTPPPNRPPNLSPTLPPIRSTKSDEDCEESLDLDEFPQWREEAGYWLGELSFYQGDGTPQESRNWNYPYDSYRGFITGNIKGVSYRQRNVFLYPPQTPEKCAVNSATTGSGVCGTNGNSKNFEADQSASTATPSCDGTIEGPFGPFQTKTTLVGDGTALLYQVYYGDLLYQSQTTTLSGNGRRTRSAHGFNVFLPGERRSDPYYCSFYRERRVNATEFYDALNATLDEYQILDEDACARDGGGNLIPGVTGGFDACVAHLEETFQL